jgi:hypothetical protein
MESHRREGSFLRVSGILVALAVAVLAGGNGCSGSVAPGDLGNPDGGGGGDATAGDAAGGGDAAGDAGDSGFVCAALNCFPQCPNGTLKDSHGCFTCQCAPFPDGGDAGGTGTCTTSADCANNGLCGFLVTAACAATGQCFPNPGGSRCGIASAMGCGCHGTEVSIDPSCVSGLPQGYNPVPVLHAGVCADDGGACVSPKGGPCGGNTATPCTCATGLTCTPGDSGLPFGDVGGTCQ